MYPNLCECKIDYKLKPNSTTECEAFCENCTDGTCIEPHHCECLSGFQMNENYVCERICLPECIFGECVNGTCICDDGFSLFNQSTHNCQPYFENSCDDATCKDDNTFERESTTEDSIEIIEEFKCSPPCEIEECKGNNNNNEGCTNGTCISPGVCKCFDGFELHPSTPFLCVLENDTVIESAPVKAIITNYISLTLALLIVGLAGITLILLLNRRNCKVNYNVDEKGK